MKNSLSGKVWLLVVAKILSKVCVKIFGGDWQLMAEVVGSDSTHSEFEEVTAVDTSNFSDGEIIDSDWHYELENVLNEGFVDQGMLKNVCKCRSVPDKFRYTYFYLLNLKCIYLLDNVYLEINDFITNYEELL